MSTPDATGPPTLDLKTFRPPCETRSIKPSGFPCLFRWFLAPTDLFRYTSSYPRYALSPYAG